MKRSFNPTAFNLIANHESCRPWMGNPFSDTDLTLKITNVNNYCFLTDNEDGGYILENIGQGHYVAHTLALPSARGKPMLDLMHEGFHFLFVATDCVEVHTSVPDDNVAAMRWSEIAGFRHTFRREKCFPSASGEMVGETFMSLSWIDWVAKAPRLKQVGEEFHAFIEQHQNHPNHDEDEFHDRMVGFALLGCKAGNTVKAISLYSLWARQARYEPATILSLSGPLINIWTRVLQLNEGSLEVVETPQG